METLDTNGADTVGEAIRIARERKGWRQQELADHLNVHRQSVTQWENGRQDPRPGMRIRLAQLLGIWDELGVERPEGVPVEAPAPGLPKVGADYQEQLDRIEGQLAVILGILRRRR